MKRIAGMLVLTLTVGIAAALIGWADMAWANHVTISFPLVRNEADCIR